MLFLKLKKTKEGVKIFVLTFQYNIWLSFMGMPMILKSFDFNGR